MKAQAIKDIKKSLPPSFVNLYHSHGLAISFSIKSVYGKLSRQFIRPSFPKLEDGKLYLHLGCGGVNHEKFVNIDALPAPHIHYIRGLDNLSPFKDNSVDLIYGSHCLEHFSHLKVPNVLGEWYRVLKTDGILRLSVPNFDALCEIYKESGNDLDSILEVLMGRQDYKYNFHMTAFTQSSLTRLFKNVGFREVREWQPGSCELTTFRDFSNHKIPANQKYYPISLNLEAIK
ncbi:MAG: methyltransferase domain-containing protein [Cyanobacteriota bacterium]